MADADWDADNFEPDESITKKAPVVLDKWEGEDDDEDVKDNWDDDDDEDKVEKAEAKAKEKKKLSDKIKEKELQQKQKQEELRKRLSEAEAPVEVTPEDQAEERLRAQRMQEETDLELAREAFGVEPVITTTTPPPSIQHSVSEIETMQPSTKEDFNSFEKLLKEKISQYEQSVHYSSFLESLFRELCISLEVDDLKKISTGLSVLLSEKQKQEKQNKGKKKKKGVVPAGGMKAKMKDDLADYGAFDGGYAQDYEDFM